MCVQRDRARAACSAFVGTHPPSPIVSRCCVIGVRYECTVWSCRAAGARGGILTTAVGWSARHRVALEAVPAFEAGRALWAINVCVNSREILCLENATSSKL